MSVITVFGIFGLGRVQNYSNKISKPWKMHPVMTQCSFFFQDLWIYHAHTHTHWHTCDSSQLNLSNIRRTTKANPGSLPLNSVYTMFTQVPRSWADDGLDLWDHVTRVIKTNLAKLAQRQEEKGKEETSMFSLTTKWHISHGAILNNRLL